MNAFSVPLGLYRLCAYACPRAFRREHLARLEAMFLAASPSERAYASVDMVLAGLAERCRIAAMDARFALRGMRGTPLTTAIIILTFTLGIGATAAAFAIVDSVLLRPLPFPRADRLVQVRDLTAPDDRSNYVTPPQLVRAWQRDGRAIVAASSYSRMRAILTGAGEPVTIATIVVRDGYFRVLGMQPVIGRFLDAGDARAGAPPVAVISYRLWHARFGGEAAVIGRPIALDGRAYRVVGVAPQTFMQPDTWEFHGLRADAWLPQRDTTAQAGPATVAIARLHDGVSRERAQAEFALIAGREPRPASQREPARTLALVPLVDALVGNERAKIGLLVLAALSVLAVACVNAANLFIVRGSARTFALGVRVSLGASRARIVAELLTETALFAVFGACGGLAVAAAALRAFAAAYPAFFTRAVELRFDVPAACFVVAATIVATAAAGVMPALLLSDTSPQAALREQTRGSGGRTTRLRSVLTVVEIALAVALVTQCALLIRSYAALGSVDPGFRTNGVIVAAMPDLPDRTYPDNRSRERFTARVLRDTRALPGVAAASAGFVMPFLEAEATGKADISGGGLGTPRSAVARVSLASDGFFRDLSIPVVRGREFLPSDRYGSPPVALVNAAFVRRYFPNGDPLGKRLHFGIFGEPAATRTIVGVVADTKMHSLTERPQPAMYADIDQLAIWTPTLVIRTRLPAAAVARSVNAIVRSVDPALPPASAVLPYAAYLQRARDEQYVSMLLLAVLGSVALVLAAGGVYGIVSYGVVRRTHEFGIRLAMGARPRTLVRAVLREAALPALTGIAAGVVLAALAAPLEESLLYSVTRLDPLAYAGASAVFLGAALVASWIPARRIAGAEPVLALRCE